MLEELQHSKLCPSRPEGESLVLSLDNLGQTSHFISILRLTVFFLTSAILKRKAMRKDSDAVSPAERQQFRKGVTAEEIMAPTWSTRALVAN